MRLANVHYSYATVTAAAALNGTALLQTVEGKRRKEGKIRVSKEERSRNRREGVWKGG